MRKRKNYIRNKDKNKPNKDIKSLDIPNVCFSLTSGFDSRETLFRKQRIERGFDDSETWDLAYTISSFIIPRLKEYIKIADNVIIRDEDLKNDTLKALEAFRTIREDCFDYDKDKEKIVEDGLKKFSEIFCSLWW